MTKHLRAIFAACLLMVSLQPPGAMAADPIFRHNLHAGVTIDPPGPPNPNPNPPNQSASISYSGLGTLASGTPVSSGEGTPSISGLTAPVAFTYTGNFPSGLTLNPSSGVISGQPTTAGRYVYSVNAKDANGTPATAPLTTVTVGSITYSLSSGTVGQPFTPAAPSVLGLGSATFTVSGSLPPGLGIDHATGTISGTADSGYGTSPSYRIAVASAPSPAALSYPSGLSAMRDGTALTLANGSPAATGFSGAVTYSASGALPAGITVNGTSGVVSGTPEAAPGSYSFTVTAADTSRNTASATVTASVSYPSASIAYATPWTITVETPFTSAAPAISGLYGTVGYALATGTLPSGLVVNPSTGVVDGTPTAYAAYSIAIRATDSIGNSAVTSAISGVAGYTAATLSYPSALNSLTDGTAVPAGNGTPATTGLSAPVSYAVGGGLPAGLAIDASTGIISGTPEAAPGSYPFTVTATDPSGNSQMTTVTTTVSYPVASVAYATPWSITVGTPFASPAPTTSRLYGTVSYALATGTLPSGLSVDPSTGIVSGTPSARGAYSIAIRATDSIGNSALTSGILCGRPHVSGT